MTYPSFQPSALLGTSDLTSDISAATGTTGLQDMHPEYRRWRREWRICRDCVNGEMAIKRAGERYLLNFLDEDQVPGAYDARRMRAIVYDAVDRTLDALLGTLFSNPSTPTLPDAVTPHLDNIDLAGLAYDGFKQRIGSERLEVGRFGVLVDWSASEKRPVWVGYETEQIRNWSYEVRNSKTVLTQVILFETVNEPSPSGFGSKVRPQYRVLELTPEGGYQSRIFKEQPQQAGVPPSRTQGMQGAQARVFQQDSVTEGTRQGKSLTEIPFVCFGSVNLNLEPQKPPLLSIAHLQLDHYRLSADVKHAMHFGALPTLLVIGDDDETRKYHLGTAKAIKLPAGADAKFIEYSGGSVEQIRQEMVADENRMALLGARLLLAPKKSVETAEALRIEREGESSMLGTIAQAITRGLTKLWQLHVEWMGLPSADVKDEIRLDLSDQRLTPQEIAAQLQAVQAGHLSHESFVENLFASGIAREPEIELDRIETEGVNTPPQPAGAVLGLVNPGQVVGGGKQPPAGNQPRAGQKKLAALLKQPETPKPDNSVKGAA